MSENAISLRHAPLGGQRVGACPPYLSAAAPHTFVMISAKNWIKSRSFICTDGKTPTFLFFILYISIFLWEVRVRGEGRKFKKEITKNKCNKKKGGGSPALLFS